MMPPTNHHPMQVYFNNQQQQHQQQEEHRLRSKYRFLRLNCPPWTFSYLSVSVFLSNTLLYPCNLFIICFISHRLLLSHNNNLLGGIIAAAGGPSGSSNNTNVFNPIHHNQL